MRPFEKNDLVVLDGHATMTSRHGQIHKPVPSGKMGYVLAVYKRDYGSRYVFVEVLVQFDGIGRPILVDSKELRLASALDQMVREI